MPVKTAAHPGKAGLGDRGSHHGTLVLAESGRLSSLEDTLTSLGFSLIRPHKKFNPATAVPPLIVIADSGGWKTGGDQTARAASAGKLAVRSILIEDDETGTVEMPGLTHILSAEFTSRQLLVAVREAHRSAVLEAELDELRQLQETGHRELEKLIEIGISLSSERNIDRLLDKILLEACNVTTADGGSIYIIDKNEQGERVLHFSNTISTSLNVDFKAFAIPINPASIAGYVAATGESLALDDCYKIPARYQFSINKSFDENNNYRTKSMLAVAMRNQKEEITGVIQLINRKPSLDMVLTSPSFIEEHVISFDQRSCALIEALASQAAVALENYRLYRDIENLFEGFVQASVTAIESRDPTTCGHSERVATLTVGIAEMVNRITTGKLREVRFDENQLKEIRYAGLLHDFGKVGVREHVLLKAKKLYPDHLKLVRRRFDIARQIYRKETNRSKVEFLLA
ncbi:MAG: GAF domain-containing protein, partial [Candidatus Glassbacteria bacterium]